MPKFKLFGGSKGGRKPLLKKNSSKSFSDITKSSNPRGIGQKAAPYNKPKGRRVQNYIPSGPTPKKPSMLQRTVDKFKYNNKPSKNTLLNSRNNLKRTGRDTTSDLRKSTQSVDLMNESYATQLKRRGQMMRTDRQNAARSRVMGNLDKLSAAQGSKFKDNLRKRGQAQYDTIKLVS